jgi:transposase-like protein
MIFMKYVPPKFDDLKDMAGIDIARLTEDEARKILEDIRWPRGPVCPKCGSKNAVRINGKSAKVRDGLLRCKDCRRQFTVTVGTIMQGSHITLRQWLQAFHAISSSKKGVSALQLQRNLGLHTYRAAWYLAHRIRLAMRDDLLASMLKGIVEVDETYVGGKPRNKNPKNRGRGTKKTPVLVLVEREGNAVSKPIKHVDARTLKGAILEMVDRRSRIVTDEWPAYCGLEKEFKGGHDTINHGTGEYVKGDITTNTAESYFALLKRGLNGIFHHVSKRHLHRYCTEFSFRWNRRNMTDGERTALAIKGMVGKRMKYNNPMA